MDFKLTVASYVTLFRMALVPFIFILVLQDSYFFAVLLFLIALVSDFLDGQIARRWNQESEFGRILDPAVDKLLMISAFIALIFKMNDFFLSLALYFFILKELIFVGGATILKLNYNLFVRPTMISNMVGISEMFLVMTLFLISYFKIIIPSIFLYSFFAVYSGLILIFLIYQLFYVLHLLAGRSA